MNEEKLLAVLRLQKSKAIGDILAKKLIVHIGDVESIFKEKPTTLKPSNALVTPKSIEEESAEAELMRQKLLKQGEIEFLDIISF